MKKTLLLLVSMLFCATACLYAADVYVKVGGNGNGESWENAKGDLGEVLLNAASGTTVHVAAGEYKPTVNFQGNKNNKREFRFKFSGGVTVLGGYPASGEGERDPLTNATILNGDLGDGTQVYTVSYISLGSEMAVIDGLTLKNGKADSGDHFGDFSGGAGAIILLGGSNPLEGSSPAGLGLRLENCIIEDCSANWGGAMKLMKPDAQSNKIKLEIKNCTFRNNNGGQSGAGFQANGYEISIENSVFENNTSPESGNNGGAIAAWDSSIEIKDSEFKGNGAGSNGGAVFSERGTFLKITDCDFENNYGWEGGAIRYIQDDEAEESVQIEKCNFIRNVDAPSNGNGSGGAINFSGWNSTMLVKDCLFEGNAAGNAGGALRVNGILSLQDCTLKDNQSGAHAGIWLDGPEALLKNLVFNANISTGNAEGTAMKGQVNDLAIEDCQFYDNVGFSILGIGWNSNARLSNISIYDNTATALAFQNATADLDNMVISNNTSMSQGGVINANWEGVSSITIKNSSIVNNTAAAGQTNIFRTAGSAVITFDNTLFTLNKIGASLDNTDYVNSGTVTVVPLYSIINNTMYEDEDDFFGSPVTPFEFDKNLSELVEDNGIMVHKLIGDNNSAIATGNPAMAGTKDITGCTRSETPSIGAWEADRSGSGIHSEILSSPIIVYPMPVSENFTIALSGIDTPVVEVLIMSMDGKCVSSTVENVVNGLVPCNINIPSGVYLLIVKTKGVSYSTKLIVK